ncbi:translation initiation factor IF-2, mitochondrial isoform X1 [Neodiprion virginianus]|uniref:translation initiation factor IF-2, mitochondrial isoform X1 n=1 Tax=Neodiprion virginianus TaxID=2961670 RepID=UPI001EE6B6DF|nr:translation initiation factor IF-2, mitochondrial isoform X1 [Neodiprion virginianus]
MLLAAGSAFNPKKCVMSSMAALVIRKQMKPIFYRRLYDITKDKVIGININKGLTITWDQRQLFHATIWCRRKKAVDARSIRPILYPSKSKTQQLEAVKIWKNMTVAEVAQAAEKDISLVFEAMEFTGGNRFYKNRNSVIDDMKEIREIIKIFGRKVECISQPSENTESADDTNKDALRRPPPDPAVLIKRHPVVTVMGHVDHGKTTLLDSLRSTAVVDSEFGGITQHIGAFNVTLDTNERITFLDTPGHAAFSAMRARGAHVTDIVILVVAADDGVMEQTIQSIRMAKDAKVPIIVAINKIDKPDADIERTKAMLAQNGIQVEDLGGDVQSINISALKKINLTNLTEAIAAQAEVMSLQGDPTGLVEAVVIEASNDPGRGKLATVLIQRGTLRKGSILVCGKAWAKVRSMFNEDGKPVMEGKLSDAVQVIGWREMPVAGDEILEVESEKRAKDVIKYRMSQEFEKKAKEHAKAAEERHQQHLVEYRENLLKKRALGIRYKMRATGPRQKEKPRDDGSLKVNVIIKGDVGGSVEAILDVLDTYSSTNACQLNLIHYGVGNVTETDIDLADAFNAIIYSFNVETPGKVGILAKENGVQIRPFNVIYKLIDDLKDEISRKLPVVQREDILGEANVLQQFEISERKKTAYVAGCRCVKGMLKKSALFKLVRGKEVIHSGPVESLRHIKSEVETIKNGVECGLRLKDPEVKFQPGDTLVCYNLVDEEQKCEWDPGF